MTRHMTAKTDLEGRTPTVPSDAAASAMDAGSPSAVSQRRIAPRTRAEAEERYVAARDAWTAAMRAAGSGRPADLAALAIAQEAYETASADRERWAADGTVAIPVEREASHRDLSAIVQNELSWRQVRTREEKPLGILGRIRGRVRGR